MFRLEFNRDGSVNVFYKTGPMMLEASAIRSSFGKTSAGARSTSALLLSLILQ